MQFDGEKSISTNAAINWIATGQKKTSFTRVNLK
jgi:hypothetical protein